ncbi:bifunctional MaoC family dehydratase N-terminal/OB-fold nucleic acid binding domain-containing protein, partial [Nocardioides marmoribigeumensis]
MTTVEAAAEELKALGETEPRLARDPVNQPQVHTWLEAMGDAHPVYRDTPEAVQVYGGPVAPVAMHQVWTMYGLGLPGEDPVAGRAGDPLHQMMGVLDEAGYTSVLGTNSDQTYDRPLRPGEQPTVSIRLESVVGPKQTGVGEGWFVTTRSIWRVGDEQVGTMLFRVLKFKPAARKGPDLTDPARTVRPSVNRDNEYFFQGTSAGELRIQQCKACGALRHPPGPVCPECLAMDRGFVVAAGRGTVYSFIEHHAPQIPGKKLPLLLAVVELDEGVRMIGELRGTDRADVEIGMPVQVGFDRIDDELTLAYWEPVGAGLDKLDHREAAGLDKLDHREAAG